MEWRDVKTEIEYYNKLTPEEVKVIVEGGIKTEFWKWFRSKLAVTLMVTETQLLRKKIDNLDDTIRLGQLSAIFKSTEESLNAPEFALQLITKQSALRTPPSVKKGE